MHTEWPCGTEAEHQIALFEFLERIAVRVPASAWTYHVPNGEHRHKAVAKRLKAMGVKRGVPDIWLPVRRSPHSGLAIELKRPDRRFTPNGGVSPEQGQWITHLEAEGWRAIIAWGWEAAAAEILCYLGEDPREFGLETERARSVRKPS